MAAVDDAEGAGTLTSDDSAHRPPVRRARTWTRVGIRILAATYCWALVWLMAWTIAPRVIGWTPTVIESGSMAPLIRQGDVVIIEPDVALDELAPGQIVTFADPIHHGLTTHRVEAVEDGSLTTKGDANQIADTSPVDGREVRGRARIVVPAVGLPRVWFEQGRLPVVAGWLVATVAALWLSLSSPGRAEGPRRAGRRSSPMGRWPRAARIAATAGLATIVMAGVGPASSRAAFAALTANSVSIFGAAADFGYSLYAGEVLADGPEAYWRLGDPSALPAPVFVDDFETFSGWSVHGAGTVSPSPLAHSGSGGLAKQANNDPSGGWKALATTLGNTWTLESWLYRPSGYTGGGTDRLGIEDSGFNGYSFGANHNADTLFIDRRDGGSPSGSLGSVAFDPPEDTWYRLVLTRLHGSLTLQAYDGGGTLLATVAASDTTHATFDRVVVHGGHPYNIDDLSVWASATGIAADETAVHDAPYVGEPTRGQPGLLVGDSDTAVRFDGVDDVVPVPDHVGINLANTGQRTIELWYEADDNRPRQVLFESGGTVNGMVVYLDNRDIYARAWSDNQAWSNDLEVSRKVNPTGRVRHIVVTLDATGNTMTLYVDGVARGTDTKTDGHPLNAHSGDIGIGAMRQDTRFHDGNVTGDGYGYAGVLDEVAVYNTSLSAARVAVHYAAGS